MRAQVRPLLHANEHWNTHACAPGCAATLACRYACRLCFLCYSLYLTALVDLEEPVLRDGAADLLEGKLARSIGIDRVEEVGDFLLREPAALRTRQDAHTTQKSREVLEVDLAVAVSIENAKG